MGPVLIAGVHPCRKGWIAVFMPAIGGIPSVVFQQCFQDVCRMPFQIIAVNVPIGLPEISVSGGRMADRDARALLKHTKSTLHSAPCRIAMSAANYREAYQQAVISVPEGNGVGIAKGLYRYLGHIREVDESVTPDTQQRIYESHPELSFYFMAGAHLQYLPSDAWGAAERSVLLQQEDFPRQFVECAHFAPGDVSEYEFMAACAACWTACRIFSGTRFVLPKGPPILDARGLRMEKNA